MRQCLRDVLLTVIHRYCLNSLNQRHNNSIDRSSSSSYPTNSLTFESIEEKIKQYGLYEQEQAQRAR